MRRGRPGTGGGRDHHRHRRQTEKDQASQTYVSALADFWSYYYSLRRKTLYDFISHTDISVEFDRLIEE